MEQLIHRKVEVITPETVYKGILLAIEENVIHIQLESAWIVIPMEKVVDVRAVD